jgi:two-component system NtrC family response regulator
MEDVPKLARHLLQRSCTKSLPAEQVFAEETIEELMSHSWPGNVRELANVVEHASILCDEFPITPGDLPQRFALRRLRGPRLRISGAMSLREIEMAAIYESLERNDGNKPAAAEELGVSLKTLYNKLNAAANLEKTA